MSRLSVMFKSSVGVLLLTLGFAVLFLYCLFFLQLGLSTNTVSEYRKGEGPLGVSCNGIALWIKEGLSHPQKFHGSRNRTAWRTGVGVGMLFFSFKTQGKHGRQGQQHHRRWA
jgi:hypothetical protein